MVDIWPPTSVVVPGPDGPDPWAAPHHGRFRIADFGERQGNISFGAKMSASDSYYVKIYARFSYWDEAGQAFSAVGADVLAYGPSTVGDEGGEFGYRSSIFFDLPAHPDATHWQPVIQWFSQPPKAEDDVSGEDSGIPPGGRVRMDDFYIPDNGYPISDRPYLDGDQPGGVWEGPRSASTSIYGDRNAAIKARMVTLEPELLIPEGDDLDLASLTYLDDDLKI